MPRGTYIFFVEKNKTIKEPTREKGRKLKAPQSTPFSSSFLPHQEKKVCHVAHLNWSMVYNIDVSMVHKCDPSFSSHESTELIPLHHSPHEDYRRSLLAAFLLT